MSVRVRTYSSENGIRDISSLLKNGPKKETDSNRLLKGLSSPSILQFLQFCDRYGSLLNRIRFEPLHFTLR